MRAVAAILALSGTCALTGSALGQVSVGDDCNGNGTPDVLETGPASATWGGPTSGGLFSNPNLWVVSGRPVGRPGTNTAASVTLSAGTSVINTSINFDCSNAVSTLGFSDGGRAGSRLTLNMFDRALVVNGSNLTINATGGAGSTPTSVVINRGLITVPVDRPTGLVFSGTGTGTSEWSLRNGQISAPSVTYGTLSLVGSLLSSGPLTGSGASTLNLLGASLDLERTSALTFSAGQTLTAGNGASGITLGQQSTPYIALLSGSTANIQGGVSTNGWMLLYGKLDIWGQSLSTGTAGLMQSTAGPVYVSPDSTAALRLHLDLEAPSTAQAVIRSSTSTVNMRGQLQLVHDGTGAPVTDVDIPVAAGASISGTFGSVRIVPEPPENIFPMLTYGTDKVFARLVRGSGIRGSLPVTSNLNYAFTRICTLTGVTSSTLVAGLVPGINSSQVIVMNRLSSGGLSVVRANSVAAGAVDMISTDLDGDGAQELVIAYGSSGKAIAYKISSTSGATSVFWTYTLPGGGSCNAVAPYSVSGAFTGGQGASLMPVGSKVLVGNTKSSGGTVTVVDGASGTPDSETPTGDATAQLVRGTDIDNDDDADIVVSGDPAALVSGEAGVTTLVRGPTGGFTIGARTAVPGAIRDLEAADLNGDGRGDVVVVLDNVVGSPGTTARPNASILLSQGTTLGVPMPLDLDIALDGGSSLLLADGDLDGDLDLITTSMYYDANRVLRGQTTAFPLQAANGTLSIGRKVVLSSNPARWVTAAGQGVLVLEEATSTSRNIQAIGLASSIAPGDLDNSGSVDAGDIASILLLFGPCPTTGPCVGDLDGSGEVDSGDIASLLLLFS